MIIADCQKKDHFNDKDRKVQIIYFNIISNKNKKHPVTTNTTNPKRRHAKKYADVLRCNVINYNQL